MKSPHVKKTLILGDIFLDIFQTTEVLKISPERPVPVLKPIKKKLCWVVLQMLLIILNQ